VTGVQTCALPISLGSVLFSDIPANKIYEYDPLSAQFSVFRDPSNNSNGLALDPNGLLLAAEHGGRRVSRANADGTIVTVADMYQGKKLNSPNDVIVRKDGNIYFTDPPYGLANPSQSDLGYFGIYRVPPSGVLELVAKDLSTPNGVALSPDEKTLYVDDTQTGIVRLYPVNADGSLGTAKPFVQTSGTPDGMTVDGNGNVYVATGIGVEVFKPDGMKWGVINVPEQPSNCAFGTADKKTLFITARTGFYKVAMKVPGLL